MFVMISLPVIVILECCHLADRALHVVTQAFIRLFIIGCCLQRVVWGCMGLYGVAIVQLFSTYINCHASMHSILHAIKHW